MPTQEQIAQNRSAKDWRRLRQQLFDLLRQFGTAADLAGNMADAVVKILPPAEASREYERRHAQLDRHKDLLDETG